MKKAAIIGGAGYTAGELVRILANHPAVDLAWIHSESHAGLPVASVHPGLEDETDLVFTDRVDLGDADVLFLCGAHGKSADFWSRHTCPDRLKVIDLAQDFRDESHGYVYGLPEVNRERIRTATKVANPGCFATALQLALLPLANAGLLHDDIHVTAVTGSTGAGVKPSPTTHFSWRSGNLSVYKAFTHQHLAEIRRTLTSLQPGFDSRIDFVPVRGDFPRGIFAPVYTRCDLDLDRIFELYSDFYRDAPFTVVTTAETDLKRVVNTNRALISLQKVDDLLLATCVIDNLLKGASGQAVQNMNLMLGLPEDTGLRLKAVAF